MNFFNRTRTRSKALTYLLLLIFTLATLLTSGCQGYQDKREAKIEEENYQIAEEVDQLKAHFIDVGQGDAILIQASKFNMLIDAGERDSAVVEYLKAQGIRSLDLVVGTHPHADHIGGMVEVLKEFKVTEVIDPGVGTTSKTFEQYLTQIDEQNIKFTEGRAGMTRELSQGITLRILHPSTPSSKDLNAASIVIKLTYGDIDFLFTGDAVNSSEKEMLAQQGQYLKSEILKVSHHGSSSSTLNKFLKAVDPQTAVIMVGADNSYGHPHKETMSKLKKARLDIYRTDKQGNILISTDGKTYEVETERKR